MNEAEHEKYLNDMKAFSEYILQDEDRTIKFLIDSGIYNQEGEPADWWKNDEH